MEQVYSIYLMPSESEKYPLFKCVQGDTNTRKISATILNDDGSPFQNESGITATYQSRKPDGTGTSHSATITASSTSFVVSVTLTAQDLAAPGTVKASIILTKSGTILATMPFEFNVVAVPMGSNVQSTSDYQQMQDATAAANTATQTANTAATTAVQTANNAAQQALSIANTAADNANDAADYATEAADTASNYNIDLLAEGYDATAIYIKGDYAIYQGALYRCLTDILTPEAWTASHWLAVELGADVAEAQRDATEGYSDTLTAGDLTSDEYQTDDEPYLFRRTFGGACNHEMDTLVGGTVAWNQLIRNGDFSDGSTSWNRANATLTVSNNIAKAVASSSGQFNVNQQVGFLNSHVYIICVSVANSYDVTNEMGIAVSLQYSDMYKIDGNQQQTNLCWIRKADGNKANLIFTATANSTNSYIELSKVKVYDLTKMFGSTIADYIYSLERTTAGSGIAWVNKYINLSVYHAYDAGSLKSVEAVAHRMVGFNQWDEQWEVGSINPSTGADVSSTARMRSVHYIPVIGGETYYIKTGNTASTFMWNYYDEDKNFVESLNFVTNATLSVPSNVRFMRFASSTTYGATYNNDICINFSSDRNGQYEPYKQHTYKLSPLTLRGIPKLTDGKLTYDGDTYKPSGQVVRKYGVVDLGTLTWEVAGGNRFVSDNQLQNVKIDTAYSIKRNATCSKYQWVAGDELYNNDVKGFSYYIEGNRQRLFVKDTSYSTKEAFKTAMSGVYLVYELATPTTETASPYEPTQVVYADGTEEYISNSIMPVGHVTRYPVSIKAKIYELIDTVAQLQALVLENISNS